MNYGRTSSITRRKINHITGSIYSVPDPVVSKWQIFLHLNLWYPYPSIYLKAEPLPIERYRKYSPQLLERVSFKCLNCSLQWVQCGDCANVFLGKIIHIYKLVKVHLTTMEQKCLPTLRSLRGSRNSLGTVYQNAMWWPVMFLDLLILLASSRYSVSWVGSVINLVLGNEPTPPTECKRNVAWPKSSLLVRVQQNKMAGWNKGEKCLVWGGN